MIPACSDRREPQLRIVPLQPRISSGPLVGRLEVCPRGCALLLVYCLCVIVVYVLCVCYVCCIVCPRRCAPMGVSFGTLSLGWGSWFQHVVKSAEHAVHYCVFVVIALCVFDFENAEHSETAGHTHEGTPPDARSRPSEMGCAAIHIYIYIYIYTHIHAYTYVVC